MANTEMIWTGDVPKTCELCGLPIKNEFIDGKTIYGPWATMCFLCGFDKSVGLGVGKGQKYKKKGRRWIKVEG